MLLAMKPRRAMHDRVNTVAPLLAPRGPSRNSLRSLRSLRSDSRDESVHEARCARGHEPLRCSAPQMRCARRPATALREALVSLCRGKALRRHRACAAAGAKRARCPLRAVNPSKETALPAAQACLSTEVDAGRWWCLRAQAPFAVAWLPARHDGVDEAAFRVPRCAPASVGRRTQVPPPPCRSGARVLMPELHSERNSDAVPRQRFITRPPPPGRGTSPTTRAGRRSTRAR